MCRPTTGSAKMARIASKLAMEESRPVVQAPMAETSARRSAAPVVARVMNVWPSVWIVASSFPKP